jgi:cytochrome c biogenesis protein CcmG/thiol:disulfide interchange protein DsbE
MPDRRGRLVALTATLLLVLGAALLLARPFGDSDSATTDGGRRPVVGEQVGDFAAPDVDGRAVSLSALRGRPVWLTFGATWCAPCRVEAPDLQAAYTDGRGAGLALVAVYQGESATTVRDFATTLGLDYTHVPDPGARVTTAYRVVGLPTHVFVDRQGAVRAIDAGVLAPELIKARIAEIGG